MKSRVQPLVPPKKRSKRTKEAIGQIALAYLLLNLCMYLKRDFKNPAN
jgi:hypothetical protein